MQHGFLQRDLPVPLADLAELAFDLRWNNCATAVQLWKRLDPETWERTENPFLILASAHQDRLDAAAHDPALLASLEACRREIRACHSGKTEFEQLDPAGCLRRVAYFSMEFGLSESLPIYSGGLGMLAGDHLKTASDLGVPLTGVGLLYQQGYFRQGINSQGEQQEAWPFNDPGSIPVTPVLNADGSWLRVTLPLPGRKLMLRVWKVRVGRVRLLLLDSNDPMNTPWDRGITAQLYDAGRDKRLLQEIVLGVGGWRLIEQIEGGADVCHLNEGHAAFAVLARAVTFARRNGIPVRVAFEAVRAGNVFTTHTPVEAAFDRYDPALLEHYGRPFLNEAELPLQRVLALGRRDPEDESEPFNMAWLAMRGCAHVNGVSQLHAEVSQSLFSPLFPRWPEREVPVKAVTNGVHVPTWGTPAARLLWDGAGDEQFWTTELERAACRVRALPAERLWAFRTEQRSELVQELRSRCERQIEIHGGDIENCPAESVSALFDPNVLTIGLARRCAEYKRANLLLSNPDRLKRLLLETRRPVQFIVAGKAHPHDGAGKTLVQKLAQFFNQPELLGRAVFLEDYDMVLAQHLVAGVDVWLNTPRRPAEACGTSGMKVLVNGGLNVSVLDGWWDEVFGGRSDGFDAAPSAVRLAEPSAAGSAEPSAENSENKAGLESGSSVPPGWAIGSRDPGSNDEVDDRDARSLFELLEQEIIPEFYDRSEDGIPHHWVERVRASMTELTPRFSSVRMLREYVRNAYLPAARAFSERSADGARLAAELLSWSDQVAAHWSHLRIGSVRFQQQTETSETGSGNSNVWRFTTECWLDELNPDFVRVELFADSQSGGPPVVSPMQRLAALPGSVNGFVFAGTVPASRPAEEFTVRIAPFHPSAFVPLENQRILWAR